jgi:uncharacterized protein
LAVTLEDKFIATTPDLIVIFDEDSFQAIPVERLQYGLKVTVCVLPAPAPWLSERGLQLVGPATFGFKTDYITNFSHGVPACTQ